MTKSFMWFYLFLFKIIEKIQKMSKYAVFLKTKKQPLKFLYSRISAAVLGQIDLFLKNPMILLVFEYFPESVWEQL